VAVIALISGRNVIDRLAWRALIVVTAKARPKHLEMIDSHDRCPCTCAMTGFAALGHDIMSRRLSRRADSACVAMTPRTISGGADEHAVDMATGTLAELMRAIEPESGREVIELRSDCSL
jgi:hypothetical protein